MRDKVYLIFDKTNASLKIKSILIKKVKITSLIKSNIIIVLGGDGFMLQTLKKLKYLKSQLQLILEGMMREKKLSGGIFLLIYII